MSKIRIVIYFGLATAASVARAQTNTSPQSGNVGIGTMASPTAPLEVNGAVQIDNSNALQVTSAVNCGAGGATCGYLKAVGSSGSGHLDLQAFYAGVGYTTPLVLNPSGGNVGIGTTNLTQALTVNGNITLAATFNGPGIYLRSNTGNSSINSAIDPRLSHEGMMSGDGSAVTPWGLNLGSLPWTWGQDPITYHGGAHVFRVTGANTAETQVMSVTSSGVNLAAGGITFPDGTTQTTALNSTRGAITAADPTYSDINVTLTGASIPVINFTRWTGNASVQDNAYAGLFWNPIDQAYDFGIGTGISATGNQTATNTVLTVAQSGNVGIGTTNPGGSLPSGVNSQGANLEVRGSIAFTSGKGGAIYFQDGTIQSTAFTGVLCGGDYAESVDVNGDRTNYGPGDVLVVDPDHDGRFLKSADTYSTLVMGVYSTKPGAVGRRQATPKSGDEVPMAMIGIVPTKVSAGNGAIKPGDLLVTSSIPGYAMKGTDRSRMMGAVIGKALGHLDSGRGVIEVGITLQ